MTNGELTRLSVCSLAQPALALLDTSIHLENSMHSRFTWRYLRHLAAASFIAALGACGGGENPDIAPTGAPAITAQPQAAAVTVGETAKFSVTVTGAEPLKYQWRRNGQPISGADQSRYNTAPTAPNDDGAHFSVVITNAEGSVTSESALLSVNAAAVAPTITTPPRAVNVAAGEGAAFSVVATGSGPLTYQWLRNGSPIAGATDPDYRIAATALADDGAKVSVRVGNAKGQVTSPEALLTVKPGVSAPVVTQQPADVTVAAGQGATFSVATSTGGSVTYQWRRNGLAIAGATGPAYTAPALQLADTGSLYSVILTNTAGSTLSSAARLTVLPAVLAPAFTVEPQSITANEGASVTFSVTVSGTAPLTLQWQRDGRDIPGANGTSYTLTPLAVSDHGARFTVRAQNAGGSALSTAATLSVVKTPMQGQPLVRPLSTEGAGTLIVKRDGTVLELATNGIASGEPLVAGTLARQVPLVANVAGVYADWQGLTYVVTHDGAVKGWGLSGVHNLLGGGIFTRPVAPTALPGKVTSVAVSRANGFATFMLLDDGTVWSAPGGEMVFDYAANAFTPKFARVADVSDVVALSSGNLDHPMAIRGDGTVWLLTSKSTSASPKFTTVVTVTRVVGLSNIAQVSCGGGGTNMHCLAIDKNSDVWAWGRNNFGQLGDGTQTDRPTPVRLAGLPPMVQVVAGTGFNSHARSMAGSVYSWGNGSFSGIADSAFMVSTPRAVPDLFGATALSASGSFGSGAVMVMLQDGTVWGWGSNANGQLGRDDLSSSPTPVQAIGVRTR
jgi:hypothetical protein